MIDKKQKKVIFFCPGPEYLFYTSGIFYIWELALLYNVVLLLDFTFNKIEILERLKQKGVIYNYFPLDSYIGTLSIIRKYKKQKFICQISRNLFEKYQPVAIIQHNDVAPINIYFFEEACSRKVRRIIYSASLVLSDCNQDFQTHILLQKTRLAKKWKLPLWLASCCYEIKHLIGYYINYNVLPFIIKGHIFKPRLNAVGINGRWYNNSNIFIDYSLTHSEKERKSLQEIINAPVTLIQFPMIRLGNEVFEFLYGAVVQENIVLVLPTSDEIDCFMKIQKLSRSTAVKHYFNKWIEAINIIADKFPSYKVGIKFKANEDCELFERYYSLLTLNERIIIIPTEEDTTAFILLSRVVLSTNSTVLWWANFLHSERVLISLDLIEKLSGNYYEDVEGICYFNGIKLLEDYDFSRIKTQNRNPAPGITLTEFMQTHIGV